MSKRPSNGELPPAKKSPIFMRGANASGPIRGTYDPTTPASLIHYVADDPLAQPPPDAPVVLVMYDLDGTLIRPKSGAKFPKSADDWVWWDASVPKQLKADVAAGRHVVVLSNQATKSPKLQRAWKEKIPLIATKIPDVPLRVLAATQHDVYRKPQTGMYDFVVALYEKKGWKIDHENSVYVGDAAGRKADHSNTDYTMALNAGLRFFTPEEHFLGRKPTYPNPPESFRPGAAGDADLPAVTPSNTPISRDAKEMVLFVGPPASGKSSFYRRHFASYDHINQDTLGSRDKCVKAARLSLAGGRSVVVDNTNRDKKTRKIWLDLAKEMGVPVRLFHFAISLELAMHNEMYREYYAPKGEPHHAPVPHLAFAQYKQAYEKPEKKEGYEEVRTVNFVWEGDEAQRKLWDRYLLPG